MKNIPLSHMLLLFGLFLGAMGCRHIEPLFGEETTDTAPFVSSTTEDSETALLRYAEQSTDKSQGTDTVENTEVVVVETDSDASLASSDADTKRLDVIDSLQKFEPPKNVVFFIGDGMGLNHIAAASMFAYGTPGELFFEDFEVQGMSTTHSANTDITDSAAASTALATGHKANNGVIGLAIPGDGSELPNMVDHFQALGKATGLVTTATITHATPAGFAAHVSNRFNSVEIAEDYLTQTRPNVLMGGGGSGMTLENAAAAGYTVIETLRDFEPELLPEVVYLTGQFGTNYMPYEYDGLPEELPHLFEMSEAAVTALLKDPDGFFLMIEGARIDHACHVNNILTMIPEVLAFEQAISQVVTDERLEDTLFIVTADHGTGGLIIDANNGSGEIPDIHWTTGVHTGEDVPVYVRGKGSEAFAAAIEARGGIIDNTDFYKILTEMYTWQ